MSLSRTPEQNQVDREDISLLKYLKPLLAYTGWLFLLYSLLRFVFISWNHKLYFTLSLSDLVLIFLQGLRFDAIIIGPLVGLTALYFIFIQNKWLRIIFYSLLGIVHFILLLMNCVDIELINFMGRRFTKSSLYLTQEGQTQNLLQYTGLATFTFFFLLIYIFIQYKQFKKMNVKLNGVSLLNKIYFAVVTLVCVVVMGRGGFQYKPLGYVDAKILDNTFSHQAVLNTSYAFVKSLEKNKDLQREKYFDHKQMLQLLNLDSSLLANKTNQIKLENYPVKNFVLIIVESLSAEYVNSVNTPFLEKLKTNSLYFNNFYANGRRSIEGIASILAGIPALMEQPFLNSEFATNEFIGLGQLFKLKGYQTSFFHGATNGSMHFDQFTKASGFDHYYGKNEFYNSHKNAKDFDDQHWGIYDEPFFQYMCESLSSAAQSHQPFASALFTLSSHQPFIVPPEFEKRTSDFILNLHPIVKSIHYTDFALKRFFDCAEKQPWFRDTVFVITADHTGPVINDINQNFVGNFKIPLWIYAPNKNINLKMNTHQFAQHIDLLPTIADIYNLPLLNKNHLARSLLIDGRKTIALFSDNEYQLVGDTDLSEDRLKAIKQYFSEGLYDNKLYSP